MNKKYLSRKFIISLLGIVWGIATSLSNVGGKVGTIAGYICVIVSIVNYVVNERILDTAYASNNPQKVVTNGTLEESKDETPQKQTEVIDDYK